jgi:hypothetical protein
VPKITKAMARMTSSIFESNMSLSKPSRRARPQ